MLSKEEVKKEEITKSQELGKKLVGLKVFDGVIGIANSRDINKVYRLEYSCGKHTPDPTILTNGMLERITYPVSHGSIDFTVHNADYVITCEWDCGMPKVTVYFTYNGIINHYDEIVDLGTEICAISQHQHHLVNRLERYKCDMK